MKDQFDRNIDYMRVSVTDRCNLRCRYCMPRGVALARHSDVLTYEELLRVCGVAVGLGVTRFKVTGGEPLARQGCTGFIARLKALPGVRAVTLTTNGLLLAPELNALCEAGLDGVNISLDTLDGELYRALTGRAGPSAGEWERLLGDCVCGRLRVKVNAVLLAETFDGIEELAALAERLPVDVRFIELMPIGEGAAVAGVPMEAALARLTQRWNDLRPIDEKRGNGPAVYYAASRLVGRIGFIGAMTHNFCHACNRVRLTATGTLKPCMCYAEGADLRALLRGGRTDEALRAALAACIAQKPRAHCFAEPGLITERKTMNQIGG